MLLRAILECVGGLVILWLASEALVRFAVRLGNRIGVSTFVIGIVVVGLGTSIPELTISSLAAIQDDLELAVGNITGSNSANLSLALGTAAIAARGLHLPNPGLTRLAVVSALSVGVFALFAQGHFAVYQGVILLVLVVPVVWFLYRLESAGLGATSSPSPSAPSSSPAPASTSTPSSTPSTPSTKESLSRIWFGLVFGLGFTVIGAQVLIWGTEGLAEELEVDTGFLGLTLVAIGTSAPEIIIGIRSGLKKEVGILAGNLLGSNISNSLIVGGVVGVLGSGTVMDDKLTTIAIPTMLGLSILGGLFMITGKRMNYIEAIILIAVWGATLPFVV